MSREPRAASTWSLYSRLARFIAPYKVRLIIAIIAGFAGATSLYGILHYSPNVILPFEIKVESPDSRDSTSQVGVRDKEMQKLMDQAAKYGIDVVDEKGKLTWQIVVLGLIALPLLLFARAASHYLNRYFMRWIACRVVRDLRDKVFDNLQSQSLSFFGRNDVGRLMSSCTNDMSVLEHTLSTTIADLSRAPIEVLASVIFIIAFAVESKIAGVVSVMFLVAPICLLPVIILGRKVKKHTRRALSRIADLVSRMHENFTGIRIVKAFNMEQKELRRFSEMNANYFRFIIRALRAELLMTPFMEALAVTLGCVFLIFCFAKGIPLYQIIPFVIAAVMAYKPIKSLAQVSANLHRGGAALERIYGLLDADDYLKKSDISVSKDVFTQSVRFEHVSFRYAGEGDYVIKDANIDIPKGSVVAVVGETGSGKTTLANLLARFYDPAEGLITIDGVDLRTVEITSLRRMIGVVTQEAILFNDTIASNIAYGCEEIDMDAVQRAAKEANAHDFIMADPEGYNRIAGEKGFVLSGGEKQRVSIARAILKNPPILILDEATSALDTVTERLVQEAIARVMQDRTVFAIAHRLSTIRHADQILLMQKGVIVERGTHEELYRAGGKYRELCDMQVLGA